MVHDGARPGGSGTKGVIQEPQRPPQDHLVTREEALGALEQMPRRARQFVAHLLSRAWAEGSAGGELGPTLALPTTTIEMLGLAVARRRYVTEWHDWVLEQPTALVEDISDLGRLGLYLPVGWIRLAVSDFLLTALVAILTGEPQPFAPDDAVNVGIDRSEPEEP